MRQFKFASKPAAETPPQEKDLEQRTNGRFYTPGWMAAMLARKLLCSAIFDGGQIRVVDPFGGDGRLLVALIECVAKDARLKSMKWHFELWDNDWLGLSRGRKNLARAIQSAGLKATVLVRRWDSLLEGHQAFGSFDLVVTNPPWETLKPDIRELTGYSPSARSAFVDHLKSYDRLLAERLPNSQPTAKLYGWGTNLSRCGLEFSMKLLRMGGRCAIVLPTSLLADQISAPLRKWVFAQGSIRSIDQFPAEARPFDNVDQPCMFAVIERLEVPGQVKPVITRYDRRRAEVSSEPILLSKSDLDALDFRIPVELSAREISLLLKLSKNTPLQRWESQSKGGKLWMGRELDETGYKSFMAKKGEFAFAKGRHVSRFSLSDPLGGYVKPGAREIPKSADFNRLAWRDVSRRSQARRMHATIIPPGVVTGNSLNVAYFSDGSTDRLQALLGVFNSMAFEFQLRSRLGTGHVSLGSVRGVCTPDLADGSFIRHGSRLVERALSGNRDVEGDIDRLVADAFGLSATDRETLLRSFRGPEPDSRVVLHQSPMRGIN